MKNTVIMHGAEVTFPHSTECRDQKLIMTQAVVKQIRDTIGQLKPEQGGMLGGDLETGVVTHFHFDSTAQTTGGTYSPDFKKLTRLLKKKWNPAGIRLLGFIHSHPKGFYRPSAGDTLYASDLLKINTDQDKLLLPIVRPTTDGKFQIFPYGVIRDEKDGVSVVDMTLEIVPETEAIELTSDTSVINETFARVKNAYDLEKLYHCRVIYIGAGGAASFVEDMVRTGVGEHILIDPDVVSETNLATQQVFRKDIGRPKVDALAERIRDINPLATISTHSKRLEEITDDEFRQLLFDPIGEEKPEVTLIAGLTDSFPAQARVNALALQFGVPSLCAQVYERGTAAEVTFTYPGITPACHRCALSSRYRAYLNEAYENDVTSDGAPIFSTTRLNALKGFIAMAILHHGTEHPRWGNLLRRIGKRNLIQIRMDPDTPLEIFERTFGSGNMERILFDETVWLPQEPESLTTGYDYNCPDCGGTSNLLDARDTFEDTRDIRPQPQGGKS
jgi:hypothetical protein